MRQEPRFADAPSTEYHEQPARGCGGLQFLQFSGAIGEVQFHAGSIPANIMHVKHYASHA
jgi:hypothetical protein